MVTANIHQAKTHLSKLIERAEAGEEVVIARNGKPAVRLTPVEAPAKLSAQEIVERFRQLAPRDDGAPKGWSRTEAFLAERRLEAAWEDERVTDEERRAWLERLERHEAWPAEVEAFVASRSSEP